jgi:hypothetical protein
MRKISDVYREYKIMPFLQMHMLRVAAVAKIVCDSFDGEIEKEAIITACLLHDMCNIIKADLNIFQEATEPEGIKYWQRTKEEFIEKYGGNEHEATLYIARELGVSKMVIELIDQIRFSLLCRHAEGNDWNIKIVHYSDGRVAPKGISTYEERMQEGEQRYKGRQGYEEIGRVDLVSCGKKIEQQIFAKCKIKPEDINDETVAPIISKLREFVIK